MENKQTEQLQYHICAIEAILQNNYTLFEDGDSKFDIFWQKWWKISDKLVEFNKSI